MNCFGIVIVLAIATLQVALAVDPKFNDHWEKFKQEHGKDYDTEEEEQRRREHFESHVKIVVEHNAKFDMGLESYQMSVNHEHADKPFHEFKQTMLGAMPPGFYDGSNRTDYSKEPSTRAVTYIDWTKGTSRVTSVKNQGGCGSCWAFSVAGALEGQFYTCKKPLQEVSMQYILDCASSDQKKYDSYGCGGGWPSSATNVVKDKGGLPRLSDYPYQGKQTSCPTNKKLIMPITKSEEIGPKGDENAMAKALASKGPISVCIEVDSNMQNYRNGIYSSSSCNKAVNHAVLLVGTGTENGKDYWKIKNSWGPGWGDNGYIRIQRNAKNMCLVASYAAVPIPDCKKMK